MAERSYSPPSRSKCHNYTVTPVQPVSRTCCSGLHVACAQLKAHVAGLPVRRVDVGVAGFGDIVQALRSPATDASMCEAVGQLDQAPQQGALVWMQAEHTTLVNTKRLIFTGLQLCFGSFLDDAQEALQRLEKAAGAVGEKSSAVQINTFSLTPAAGSALRKTTGFPASTFTVQTVEGLTAIDATAGIDAILAPGVESAVLAPQE